MDGISTRPAPRFPRLPPEPVALLGRPLVPLEVANRRTVPVPREKVGTLMEAGAAGAGGAGSTAIRPEPPAGARPQWSQ